MVGYLLIARIPKNKTPNKPMHSNKIQVSKFCRLINTEEINTDTNEMPRIATCIAFDSYQNQKNYKSA